MESVDLQSCWLCSTIDRNAMVGVIMTLLALPAVSSLPPHRPSKDTGNNTRALSYLSSLMATRDRSSLGPGEALRPFTIRQLFDQPLSEGTTVPDSMCCHSPEFQESHRR